MARWATSDGCRLPPASEASGLTGDGQAGGLPETVSLGSDGSGGGGRRPALVRPRDSFHEASHGPQPYSKATKTVTQIQAPDNIPTVLVVVVVDAEVVPCGS